MTALDALPDALAVLPARPVAWVLDVGGAARLALTPDEVAPLLGVSTSQVRELIRDGRMRARNLHPGSRNGRYRIPVGALLEFLDGRDDPVPATG